MLKIKTQIPLEDAVLLNSMMLRIWKYDDAKALTEATNLLASYNARGFDTIKYAVELLRYQASKNQFVLHEDLS